MLRKLQECKLDKNPRNYSFYHISENVTVFEKLTITLGVPNFITKQWFHSIPTGLYVGPYVAYYTCQNRTTSLRLLAKREEFISDDFEDNHF